MLATLEERVISLTAHNRCDRCGSQAYMQAEHDDLRSELLFCKHHANRHQDKLLDEGWTLYWDTVGLDSLTPVALQGVES
jgi:hypothetical protein